MSEVDPHNLDVVLERIRAQAAAGTIVVTVHGEQAMADESFTRNDLLEAIAAGRILENYPLYHKGPCCLLYGDTRQGRPMHIVCSTTATALVIITVYEPTAPKWLTPTQRSRHA